MNSLNSVRKFSGITTSIPKKKVRFTIVKYFLCQYSKSSGTNYIINVKQKILDGKQPVKKLIAITNKSLYGPLLKSSIKRKWEEVITHQKNNNLTKLKELEYYTESNFDNQKSRVIQVKNCAFDVPSEFNLSSVETFPLFPIYQSSTSNLEEAKEILSIRMHDSGYRHLPSVTKILDDTMPPERRKILDKWEKKMIRQLGEEGFRNYKQGLLDKGKMLHECIDFFLRSQEEPSPVKLVGISDSWISIKHVLPELTNVKAIESRVVHPTLYYQGVLDCVATYKDVPVIIDFKTSLKPKLTLNSTYDQPLQLAAYLGALNHDPAYCWSKVRRALLLIAYPTGLPAHAHLFTMEDCSRYWRMWCQRLSTFWQMQTSQ